MSLLKQILASEAQILRDEFRDLEEKELALLERVICELKERYGFKPVRCEFGPITNPDGEIATMPLSPNTPYTCALVFTNDAGVTGKGPVGSVSASDPSINIGLSETDGQAINFTMTQELTGDETITWHDPADVIPDATLTINDAAPPFVATSVSIGAPVEGTTP